MTSGSQISLQPGRDGHFRFPRLAESTHHHPRSERTDADKSLSRLVHRARELMGNFPAMRLELGRVFCRIKRKVRKNGGRWKAFYTNNFNTSIVSYRTACRYMDKWRSHRAAQGDGLSPFTPGADRKSSEIATVTAIVQREVRATFVPKLPDYRPPLRGLGPVRRAAVIALWHSPHRHVVERKVIAVLDEAAIKYGFATKKDLAVEKVER